MATALDLLMSAKEDVNLLSEKSDICTIDAKTRIIFVPSTIVVGGVQSDKNAERIKFSCPKIVGDNLDLSKFSVRINFENVSSVDFNVSIKDQYICDDVAVDGENVTFSWLIGRNAARYMGTVRFIVCAVKTDSDSNISVEWNTTIAEVPVLEGIEIDQPQIGQEEKDVINQLLELTKNTSAEAIQNVNFAKEQAIKDIQSVSQPDTTLTIEGGLAEAKATGEAIGSLKEDICELEIGTKNIFNSRELLNATGWTRNGNSYTGTAGNLGKAYKENNYPISFEPNTKYTISLKALTNGSDSTDGIGIQFEFYYTDGTKIVLELLNNTLTETSYVLGTNPQKSISYMRIRHSSGGNNTWVLSEIQIEKGNKTNYVNPFTANDIIAREKIEILESKTNNLEENTEIKTNEVKAEIDDLVVQSNNLIIAVGIDNVKNKGFYVSTDDGYNAFPFIGVVKDKLVCVYSVGKNHTDNTSVDIFAKTSPNGVIWSKAKKIISTENVRDTITGLGHDSLGIIYFWNRKGTPVNADCSFDLYKTSDGIVFTKKSSPVFDIKPSHIGDALHIPTVGVISFYNTYRANRNSYGYVLTKDGGETWSQIEIASPTTQSDTPTEIYGVYIGDGKIIALGRSEDSAAMFQIQSNDYGKTWETKKTNITDVYLSTPTLIYGDDGYITVYYYNRADGKLKKRRAIASTVFENPSSWGEPSNIASGAVGQDAGNANSVKFNGNNIIAYYSGTDTETSVIDVIN
nr:MAG TPA: hypothetical protein [Caudoviricetes sp.]